MHNRFVVISSFLATAILLVMLNFTTPTGVGPFGVLVFFTTLYVLLFGVTYGLATLFLRMLGKRGVVGAKAKLYVAVLAFAPILLLIAQGFGSFGIATLVLVAVAEILGCFLIHKKA